ncbi:MAG: glucosamine-6-phosphate deaminase [Tissierellia bacterium]|jgi:glucosamine-6-phosphate deaminase|nr:glucosamine-6-phosphate deaminase [Tissierellia bacterium]
MKILIFENYEKMSKEATRIIAAQILRYPDSVLGLATGSTPMLTYKRLIRLCEEEIISFKKIKTFNLDEYLKIDIKNPASYHAFMEEVLFNKIDIDEKNWYIPNGNAEDIDKECILYDKKIKEMGGIDLMLLGMGSNGHIAFNEPGTSFSTRTHVVDLEENTIRDNSRFFDKLEDVPTQAITLGMRSIMESKQILFMASGANKAKAIRDAFEGPISVDVPASILQLHPNATILLDEAAAMELGR